MIQTENLDVAEIAINIVSKIKFRAISLGWKSEQIQDFTKILSVFIPAKIGSITLQGIEIIVLHPDGSNRGSLKYYNKQLN